MPGLLRGVARVAVVAGTATAVSNRVSRRQGGRWARQDDQAVEEQAPQQQAVPQQASAGGGTSDMLSQLKELGDLKASGVLSEAEFEAQKAKILQAG